MRVPQQAGGGIAKVTVTLTDMKPELVAPATLDAYVIGESIDLPAITSAFAQGNRTLRTDILRAVSRFSLHNSEEVELVLLGVADDDLYVKSRATTMARSMRYGDQRLVALLIKALAHESQSVRWESAMTLEAIGPAAAEAVPALKKVMLKDNYEGARKEAAKALGRMGSAAESAVPELTEALKDRSGNVRRAAAVSLAQIGPAARSAVPALKNTLKDPWDTVRREAHVALHKIAQLKE